MTVSELEQAVADAGSRKPCSTADPDLWFPAVGEQPHSPGTTPGHWVAHAPGRVFHYLLLPLTWLY